MRRRLVPARPRGHEWQPVRPPRSHVTGVRFRRHARLGGDDVAAWCDDLARHVRSGASLASRVAVGDTVARLGGDRGADRSGTRPRRLRRRRHPARRDGRRRASSSRSACCTPAPTSADRPRNRSTERPPRSAPALPTWPTAMSTAPKPASRRWCSPSLPVAALALLLATSPAARAAVLGSSGSICLGAGAVLNASGWWWMRRIIGRSV